MGMRRSVHAVHARLTVSCVAAVTRTFVGTVGGVRSGLDVPGPSPFSRASHDTVAMSRANSAIERYGTDVTVIPE